MLLQTLIVIALVAGSAVFALWRLLPARAKLRALDATHPAGTSAVGRWLLRLRQGVVNELAQGCSACSKSAVHVKKHSPARH